MANILTRINFNPIGGGSAAINVTYDNTVSGLAADNVQDAIDEVQAEIVVLQGDVSDITDDVADLVVLSGVPAGSTNLGTFTGSVIPDNSDNKEALQALETAIEAIPDPLFYAGTWNATTNTPDLDQPSARVPGAVYYVTVGGTHNFGSFGGSITFAAGDKVVFNGTTWDKWDQTDEVVSVFGRIGAVVAVSGDYTAAQVTNVPAGTIAAVTVQAAITELDGDIQGHITNTTGAHAGSAISNIPSGNLSATNVQSALNELQTDVDTRALHVLPSTNQVAYVSYLSGNDSTGDGSYDKPFKTIIYAMTTITDATQNKPYVIQLLADRQIETADILVKPYVSIVGLGQRATYIRSPGFNIKPDPSHATNNSWVLLKNFYLGGGTGINWDLNSLGGSNCVLIIEGITNSGILTYKGRNAGGGDYLEMYVGIQFGTVTLDSVYAQVQTWEVVSQVNLTNSQGISGTGATLNNIVLDSNMVIDGATVALNNVAWEGTTTLTTTNTVTIDSFRGLPPVSRQTLSGGTTITQSDDASMIKFDPSGSLVSTNVQDVIDEVQTEIVDHIADPTGAHAASAISNTPSGNLSSTNVQGALNELQTDVDTRATSAALTTETNARIAADGVLQTNITTVQSNLDNHIADSTAAHAASAVSVIPTGNLTSTEVQAALEELQEEIDNFSPGSPGDIQETSFSASNNISSPANVTGFVFSNAVVRSFQSQLSITIDATSDLFAEYSISGIQRGSDWKISINYTGDVCGIDFSITTAGQIQYTSTNVSGFVSNTMKFRATTNSV